MNRDFLSRLSVGALFALLSINLFSDFVHTRHVTGLLLLASEAIVVVLTVVRRPTTNVDRSAVARIAALVSTVGPALLRAGGAPHSLAPDFLTAAVSAIGLSVEISGKVTLGRSFGIVAANRGVVQSGPYLVVRHPIYVGYLVSHLAFLAAYPSPTNLAIVLTSDIALVMRALIEERTLVRDERYRLYCQRVAWHFVPGLF